jgi:hypothetical protein
MTARFFQVGNFYQFNKVQHKEDSPLNMEPRENPQVLTINVLPVPFKYPSTVWSDGRSRQTPSVCPEIGKKPAMPPDVRMRIHNDGDKWRLSM